MACEFCKSPDLSHITYERGYEPGIEVYIVGDTLHIDSVGTKADGIMHSKDIKINYCPVCGAILKKSAILDFLRQFKNKQQLIEFVECDGEVLPMDCSKKSKWSYDGSKKSKWSYDGSKTELDLDKVDISREIEILNKYAREHGLEEGKFDV